VAPGIYGADFAEDYELTERIGFGGSLTGGNDDYGFHTLSSNLFFLDTTFLSKSAFTNRGRTRKSDGGVSNTESLESFSVTLDGADMPFLPGLGYTLGVERQEGGKGDPKDELGFVAGLYGAFDVTSETTLEPILEYVYLDNAEGQHQDRQYITVGSAKVGSSISGASNMGMFVSSAGLRGSCCAARESGASRTNAPARLPMSFARTRGPAQSRFIFVIFIAAPEMMVKDTVPMQSVIISVESH
jgi:hypothetical protein